MNTTNPAPRRNLDWYMMATLDRTVCRACHAQGVIFRLVTDPATNRLRAGFGAQRAAYTRAQKGSLKRHLAEVHPDLAPRVRWDTSPVPRR